MNKIVIALFILINVNAQAATYTYCVAASKINFYPFRKIMDGKDLAYLWFTRPYISTTPDEKGLLSAFEFSPDGLIFRGKVDESAKWADGTQLNAEDAALGIVKGFQFRAIGARIKASKKNIKIIDDKTFEIRFESEISNPTGVIRDALGTSSRHNRVWPIRKNQTEIIAIGSMNIDAKNLTISFPDQKDKIKITNSKCNSSDMTMYTHLFKTNFDHYSYEQSLFPQAGFAMLNTANLNLKERQALALWLREKHKNLNPNSGMKLAEGFFLKNEPGYSETKKWSESNAIDILRKRTFKANAQIPTYREILEHAAKADGIKIEFIDIPQGKKVDIDFQITSTALVEGRLVFLQDYLKWTLPSDNFLKNAPKTLSSLKEIAIKSAATIPADNVVLQNFEAAAASESSIIPLTRRYTLAFSKKNIPFYLAWIDGGNVRIRQRK